MIIARAGDALTGDQLKVVELVSDGLMNKQIAQILDWRIDRVRYHISVALAKLELDNRVQLARWWWETYELSRHLERAA